MEVGDKIIIGGQLYKFCVGDNCGKCSFFNTSHCGEACCGDGHYERDDTPIVTDWEQVRIQAAIAAMQGMCCQNMNYAYAIYANRAVGIADALVEELKK